MQLTDQQVTQLLKPAATSFSWQERHVIASSGEEHLQCSRTEATELNSVGLRCSLDSYLKRGAGAAVVASEPRLLLWNVS